jgi:hypothetical protein
MKQIKWPYGVKLQRIGPIAWLEEEVTMHSSSVQNSYSQVQYPQAAGSSNQAQKPSTPSAPPKDTVTLSSAARQAQPTPISGDVDHDGDNH